MLLHPDPDCLDIPVVFPVSHIRIQEEKAEHRFRPVDHKILWGGTVPDNVRCRVSESITAIYIECVLPVPVIDQGHSPSVPVPGFPVSVSGSVFVGRLQGVRHTEIGPDMDPVPAHIPVYHSDLHDPSPGKIFFVAGLDVIGIIDLDLRTDRVDPEPEQSSAAASCVRPVAAVVLRLHPDSDIIGLGESPRRNPDPGILDGVDK